MTDFDMFEQALSAYEAKMKIASEETDQKNDDGDNTCKHLDVTDENGVLSCMDCGEEIEKTIFHDKEWRYYGQTDNKRGGDPNRVQIRKSEDRNIYKDVETMGFSEKIVTAANDLYSQVTKGKIFRGNSRKSIVFACIFHAYKMSDKPQTHETLIKTFNLTKRTGLKGLKHVNLNAPKDSRIHTTYITPVNLIQDLMDKFGASVTHKTQAIDIYNRTKNKSSKLNRARPQSVAAGVTYYWICREKIELTLKDFSKHADLSPLTINKIANEVANVIGTPGIV